MPPGFPWFHSSVPLRNLPGQATTIPKPETRVIPRTDDRFLAEVQLFLPLV